MSTDFSYQFNHPVSAPMNAPRPDPSAPMYASEDGVVASLSNSECIFQVKRSDETHVMTFQVLQALDQSREFRTLDEHVARILTSMPALQAQREGVVRVFEGLIERGLLVSDARFLQRVAAGPTAEPAPFRAAFIRACDRPGQLAHLLASLTEYERHFRVNRHYVLLDDSRTRAAIDRHRDLLREFARASGCSLTYIGATERERLATRLARAVPGAAVALPYLLGVAGAGDRFGGGGGINIALLLAAGARLALFDDDHRLPLRRLAQALPGLDPNPATLPSTRFYRNIENALGAGEEIAVDPLELHLGVVGRTLSAVVAQPQYAIDRAALAQLPLSRLGHLEGAAPILASHHGSYGSSRTESGVWLYQLPQAERVEFCRDRDSYMRNVEAGSIWYGQLQARVRDSANFTPFMLDDSVMLPCTNSQGRGEDALLSRVIRLCHPSALSMDLPVAVGHVQESQRRRSGLAMAAFTPRLNYFVGDFVDRQLPEFHAEDPGQRLQLLAAHLRDIGAADARQRVRQLREYLAYARADLIDRLQQQYDSAPDAPIWWQADVRSIIEANGRALIAKAPPRLGDWPDGVDESVCAELLREEMIRLAEGYEAWPALWEHAREQGERILGAI